jgi:hypothetical protein
MHGSVVTFGELDADKVEENHLIGLEKDGAFELHEIITKTAESNNRCGLLICRSFLEPEKIKTLSFWTDMDKTIFIPALPSKIKDFVLVKKDEEVASADVQSDLKYVNIMAHVDFFCEKKMASGSYKFVLVHRTSAKAKQMFYVEGISGKPIRHRYPVGMPPYDLARHKKRLARLGYVEKTLSK